MIKVFKMDVPAFTGKEKRKVYVYLPKMYSTQLKRRFPVLYMFDGHNVFFDSDATYGKSWGLGQYLNRNSVPLIVVAVECNHGENGARVQEYSPFDFNMPEEWNTEDGPEKKVTPCRGYGKETMDWFVWKLKPMIDRKYRTIADRSGTFLMGSSMGGLMALYGATAYSEVYSKACALSPAFECWADQTREFIESADVDSQTELFMDYGMNEEDYDESIEMIDIVAGLLLEKGMAVTVRTIPNGSHCEASWEKEMPICISLLMSE